MSYTCKITEAILDTSGESANINVTLVVTKDEDGTVALQRVLPMSGMTSDQLKVFGQQLIGTLLIRDGFYPTLKAAADAQFIIAQG